MWHELGILWAFGSAIIYSSDYRKTVLNFHLCKNNSISHHSVCFSVCVCVCVVFADTAPAVMWPAGCVWGHQLLSAGQDDLPEDPVLCQQGGAESQPGEVHRLPLQRSAHLVRACPLPLALMCLLWMLFCLVLGWCNVLCDVCVFGSGFSQLLAQLFI